MFAWLGKWFGKEAGNEIWTPKERRIFAYFDGKAVRKEDPVVLWKRLMDKATDIDIARRVAASQSKDARQAQGDLVRDIRYVFEVGTLKDGGLTDEEVVDLQDHFLDYLDGLKKKVNTSSTSLAATSAGSAPSLAASPATASPAASGSTANGPPTAKPQPLPSASASPKAASIPASATT